MTRHTHPPSCPACGAEPDRIMTLPQEVVTCSRCASRNSFHEWQTHAIAPGPPRRRPAVALRVMPDGEIRWQIPASGDAGFSMVFWSFWSIASLAAAVFLLLKTWPEYGWASGLMLISFPVPVLFMGLVFLYLAVVRHHARHEAALTKSSLFVSMNLCGWRSEKEISREKIRSICRIPTSRSANRQREAIEIRAAQTCIRLGEGLTPDELTQIVDELRLHVFGPPAPLPDAPQSEARMPDHFSFTVTHRMLHELPFASAALVTGVVFMIVVFRYMTFEASAGMAGIPMFFRVIEWIVTMAGNVMRVAFFLIALAMVSGGLWMWIHSLRKHLTQTILEVSQVNVTTRRMSRRGCGKNQKEYPRKPGSTLRTSLQSITGGVTLKRLELIEHGNSTTLISDIRAEDAEEIIRRLSPTA